MCAKVLKTRRGESVTYYTSKGDGYQFFIGGKNDACKGMELIKSDSDAEDLLKRYPDELSIVPESEWPPKYSKSVSDYIDSVKTEAAEKFPLLKKLIKTKKNNGV